ncbi:kinesin-like protein KIF9 isoform X2 [Ornithorhynchus anatinus]|uniref:kinesin-like protein KIF9 isoform X2 n=1 Tax=Ornithorhynchus anatinus TaxID=9258 RepID=UPI0010A83F4D|nr:kinesin-like protein KIF9 isoform X2 [Ornithorhynchus anatinus]
MSTKSRKARAFVRVRPTDDFPHDVMRFGPDNKTLEIHVEKDSRRGVVNNQQTDWSFEMDGILHDASQDSVYGAVAEEAVAQAIEGYNGTIMCYGQTGAGKTYTMTGVTERYQDRGILPRALRQVFKTAEGHPSLSVGVRVSYLEIYNETLLDLLAGPPAETRLTVTESPRGVFVKGLSVHPARHEEDAFDLLFQGEANRIVSSHTLNRNSSRSHCIFTIYLEAHSRDPSEERYVVSKINLVDLAGSERLGKTGSDGQVPKEATYINKSLTFLEQAVTALADRRREHVPFRRCKLTHALKDSLGGNCNTVLVANVYGEAAQLEETLSSLRFASRMRAVATQPAANEKYHPERMVKNLEKELLVLREELAIQNTLANRKLIAYDPLNEAQIAEINAQVHRYLEGGLDGIAIVNVRQVQEVFNQFRVILSQQEKEAEARLRDKYTLVEKNDEAAVTAAQKAGLVDADGQSLIEAESPGVVPVSNKPGKKTKGKKGKEPPARKDGPGSPGTAKDPDSQQVPTPKEPEGKEPPGRDQPGPSPEPCPAEPAAKDDPHLARPGTPPPKPEAFEEFKNERGSEINRIFKENKAILGDRRRRAGQAAQRINDLKRRIDATQQALDAQKRQREEQGQFETRGQTVIDQEEFLLLLKMKELKALYRTDFDLLRDLKAEVQYCRNLVNQCRQRLLAEFEIWYNESFRIPEEVQAALGQAGAITPGMVPANRILSLDEDDRDRYEQLRRTALPGSPDSISYYNAKARVKNKQNYTRVAAGLRPMMPRKSGVTPAIRKDEPLHGAS